MSGGKASAARKRPGGGGAAPQARGRPRTGARLAAVQALFQSEQSGESAETVVDQFIRHRLGSLPGQGGLEEGRVPEVDVQLFAEIVRGTALKAEEVDGLVARHLAKDWPLDKLDPVLRALLRAAAFELSRGQTPPARVVINEYLDITHGFFAGDLPRFANGVLDALARRLRPAEFGGEPSATSR